MQKEGEKNRGWKNRQVTPSVGDSSLSCPHSPPICHGVKKHTTGTVQLKAPEGGFILSKEENKGVKARIGLSADSALSSSLLAACPCSCSCSCSRMAAWSDAALRGGNERKALGAVSWRSNSPLASFAVAYEAGYWCAAAGADLPVTREYRCYCSVSRATLMSYRDARHNIYIYI